MGTISKKIRGGYLICFCVLAFNFRIRLYINHIVQSRKPKTSTTKRIEAKYWKRTKNKSLSPCLHQCLLGWYSILLKMCLIDCFRFLAAVQAAYCWLVSPLQQMSVSLLLNRALTEMSTGWEEPAWAKTRLVYKLPTNDCVSQLVWYNTNIWCSLLLFQPTITL